MKNINRKNNLVKKLLEITGLSLVLIFEGCNFGNSVDNSSSNAAEEKSTTVLNLKAAEADDFIRNTSRIISPVEEDGLIASLLSDSGKDDSGVTSVWDIEFTNTEETQIVSNISCTDSKLSIPFSLKGEYAVTLSGTVSKTVDGKSVNYSLSGTGTYDFNSDSNSPILIGLSKTEDGTGNFSQTINIDFEYSDDMFTTYNFSAKLVNLANTDKEVNLSTEVSDNVLIISGEYIPSGYYTLIVKWINWKKNSAQLETKDIELIFNEGNIVEIADDKNTSGSLTADYNKDSSVYYAVSDQTKATGAGQTIFNPAYVYSLLETFASQTNSLGTVTINCSDFTADVAKINELNFQSDSTVKIVYDFDETDGSDDSYMTLSSSEKDVYKAIRITTSGEDKQLAVNTFTAYSDDSSEKIYIQTENGAYITAAATSPYSESVSLQPTFYIAPEDISLYYDTSVLTDNTATQNYAGASLCKLDGNEHFGYNETPTYVLTTNTETSPYTFSITSLLYYISPDGTGNGYTSSTPSTLANIITNINAVSSEYTPIIALVEYTNDALSEHVTDNVSDFTSSDITKDYTLDMSGCTDITEIPAYAFANPEGTSKMVGIKLPVGLTKIGNNAFDVKSSYNLKNIYINSLKDYLEIEFENQTSHPFGAYGMGSNSLYIKDYDGNEITSIEIPEGITEIKAYAFVNCGGNSLGISDPENQLKKIDEYAFYYINPYNTPSFEFGSNLETIGKNAFYLYDTSKGNYSYITIPSSIYEIERGAFNLPLQNVTFEDKNVKWFFFTETESDDGTTTYSDLTYDKANPTGSDGNGAFTYASGGNKHLIKQFYAVSENGSTDNSGRSALTPYADLTSVVNSINGYITKYSTLTSLSSATFDVYLDYSTDAGFTALETELKEISSFGANVNFKISSDSAATWYNKQDAIYYNEKPIVSVNKITFNTSLAPEGSSVTTPEPRYYISTDNLFDADKDKGIFSLSDITFDAIDGYIFDGWYTLSDGTYTAYTGFGSWPSEDVTLYAKWTELDSYDTANMLWSNSYYNIAADSDVPTTTISSAAEGKEISDFTYDLDGNAYVLTDGKVERYSAGADLTTEGTTILTDVSNGHVYCDTETNKLYVLSQPASSGTNYYLYAYEISYPNMITTSYSCSRLDTTTGAAEPLVATSNSTNSLVKKYSLSGVTETSSCFAVNNNNLYRCKEDYIYIYEMSEDESSGYTLTCNFKENEDSYHLTDCIEVEESKKLSDYSESFISCVSFTDMTIQDGNLYLLFKQSTDSVSDDISMTLSIGGIAKFAIDTSTGHISNKEWNENDTGKNSYKGTLGYISSNCVITHAAAYIYEYQPSSTDISTAPYFFGPEKFISSKYGYLVIADEGFFATVDENYENKTIISQVNRVITVDLSDNSMTAVNTKVNFNTDITVDSSSDSFENASN